MDFLQRGIPAHREVNKEGNQGPYERKGLDRMTDLDRKILAKACGMCWHEWNPEYQNGMVANKINGRYEGWNNIPMCLKCDYRGVYGYNLTFTTPDDWKLARERVVEEHRSLFYPFAIEYGYYGDQPPIGGGAPVYKILSWWDNLSPDEHCQLAADFIKAYSGQFPQVADFITEIAEKKMPVDSTQITSGNGMPWEEMQRRLGLPVVSSTDIESFYKRNKESICGALELLNGRKEPEK